MIDPDVELMKEALAEARRAMGVDEVPVGCVLVSSDGEILARGHNLTNRLCDATQHAEFVAFEKVEKPERIHKLVVTIEPCIMCAAGIRRWGLQEVVYGAANERFGGCGTVLNVLQAPASLGCGEREKETPPVGVRGGVMAQEAVQVLVEFYAKENVVFAPEEKRKKKKNKTALE